MITTKPGIMHGEPCIERTRITVSAILHLLARGASDGQIVEAYAPQITPQDLADVRAWWSSPKGMRWALARLHGGATRTVIAMVQRLLGGEPIESVASDYDVDGEPIDPMDLAEDLGEIPRLLADRARLNAALALTTAGAPMKTACPTCGADLVKRVWVRENPALFVEVYACDAVEAFGLVEGGIVPLYCCGVETPKEKQ